MEESQGGTPVKGAKSNRTLWIVLAVVLVLLVCGCIAVLLAGGVLSATRVLSSGQSGVELGDLNLGTLRNIRPGLGNVEAAITIERTIDEVVTPVTVRVDNQVGEVRVVAADVTGVSVTAAVRAYGANTAEAEANLERVTVTAEAVSPSEVSIRGAFPAALSAGRSPEVDLTIRVPRNATVDVTTDVGALSVADVRGDVTAMTGVGDVEVAGVEGAVVARADVGRIDVRDWIMTGDSEVRTDVGEVAVSLSGDPAFDLEARTDLGRIESDFDVAGGSQDARGPGQVLSGTVGEGATMRLVLRTATGRIVLRRGR